MSTLKVGLWAFVFLFSAQGFALNQQPVVRVKFLTLSFPLTIEGQDISIKGVRSPNIKSVAIPKTSKFEIDLKQVGHHKIWFLRKNDNTDRLTQKYLELTSIEPKIRVGGFEVPTPVLISSSGEIISALPLDTYLEGVLAGEMPTNWPLEALKAQVVAARSYTLYQIEQRGNSSYHVQAGILDQAFSASVTTQQRIKIQDAITLTHDKVLTRYGDVIKAYYHSDCGGQTEDPDYVWGKSKKKHFLESVTDEQCALSAQNKWSLEIPLDELLEKLDSRHPELVDIKSVRVVSKTPSGRVALLAFNDSEDRHVIVSGNELRSLIGYMKLKSTSFDISQDEDSLTFAGRGFGHGSGLCQNGAKFLAEKGATAREILKHYYPSAFYSDFHAADR